MFGIYSKVIYICVCVLCRELEKHWKNFLCIIQDVATFFSFHHQITNKIKPHVDHYRCLSISFSWPNHHPSYYYCCGTWAVYHDMISIDSHTIWMVQCIRSVWYTLRDMSIFTWKIVIYTFRLKSFGENDSTYIVERYYSFVEHKIEPERIYLRPLSHLNRKWSRNSISFHFIGRGMSWTQCVYIQFAWLKIHKWKTLNAKWFILCGCVLFPFGCTNHSYLLNTNGNGCDTTSRYSRKLRNKQHFIRNIFYSCVLYYYVTNDPIGQPAHKYRWNRNNHTILMP